MSGGDVTGWTLSGIHSLELQRKDILSSQYTSCLTPAHLSTDNSTMKVKVKSRPTLCGLNLSLPHCRQTLYRLSHRKMYMPPLVKVCPWLLITLRLSSSSSAWPQAPYYWSDSSYSSLIHLLTPHILATLICSVWIQLPELFNLRWTLSSAARPCPGEGEREEEGCSCLAWSSGVQQF